MLDAEVARDIRVLVKHENFNPTNSFKVRNAFSLVTALSDNDERRRGIVAATRGNHGLGLAYAGAAFGVPVTICVPLGNNPEKNAAHAGARRPAHRGRADYDESFAVSRLASFATRARGSLTRRTTRTSSPARARCRSRSRSRSRTWTRS